MVVRIISKPKITISAGLRNIKLIMKKTKKIINKTFISPHLSYLLNFLYMAHLERHIFNIEIICFSITMLG